MTEDEKKTRNVKDIMDKVKNARQKDQEKPKNPKPIASAKGEIEEGIEKMKISDLTFVSRNRKADKKTVEFYMDTIKKAGLLVPVIINKDNKILDGERRVRACKNLGWVEVPVVRTEKDFDSVSVITNFLRMNYTAEQVMERMEYMKNELGFTQQKIALACGVSQGRVSQIFKEAVEKKEANGSKEKKSNGIVPKEKLPHKVSVRVRKLNVDITFKLDDADMSNPLSVITKLFNEIKQLDAMVKHERNSL